MYWQTLLGLGVAVACYLLLGGIAFHYLESGHEEQVRQDTSNFTQQFLEDNPCMTEEELNNLVATIVYAYDNGIIVNNDSSSAPNWDYASSMFFSGTVITTIGYGNISPTTNGGRIFFVFYAIIGIPLCLIMLAGIAENLKDQAKKIDQKMDKCKKNPRLGRILRITFLAALGMVFFIVIPSILFMVIEEWTYGESLYYCIVTLTTVGFGDYVAGQDVVGSRAVRSLYRICCGVWIFIGLAWLASLISVVQDSIQNVVKKAEHKREDLEKSKSADSPEHEVQSSGVKDVEKVDLKEEDNLVQDKPEGNGHNVGKHEENTSYL